MSLHIYRARDQKATNFVDDILGPPHKPHRVRYPGNKLFWAQCCYKRRPAKNLIVHLYYDVTYFFCSIGKGCKDPFFLAAKRRTEFRNRSAAMKLAWAKRKNAAADGSAPDARDCRYR